MEKSTECIENTEGAFHLYEKVLATKEGGSKMRVKNKSLLMRQSSGMF